MRKPQSGPKKHSFESRQRNTTLMRHEVPRPSLWFTLCQTGENTPLQSFLYFHNLHETKCAQTCCHTSMTHERKKHAQTQITKELDANSHANEVMTETWQTKQELPTASKTWKSERFVSVNFSSGYEQLAHLKSGSSIFMRAGWNQCDAHTHLYIPFGFSAVVLRANEENARTNTRFWNETTEKNVGDTVN